MSRRAPGQPYYRPPGHVSPSAPIAPKNEGVVGRFMREEIWSAEKLPGNINILVSAALFVVGIVSVRTWGDMMVPA